MRTLFRFFIVFWPSILLAQDSLKMDLDALHGHVKKTKSYQQQFKARQAIARNIHAFQELSPTNPLEHLSYLVKAISPLNDHHLALFEKPDVSLYKSYDPERVRLPLYTGEVHLALQQASDDVLVGNYRFGDWFTMAVIPAALPGEYLGVVVESKVEHWKIGEMAAWLQKRTDESLSVIYAHPYTKNYQWFSLERLREGSLPRSEVVINGEKMRFVKAGNSDPGYRSVATGTPSFHHQPAAQYTRIKSFQKNPKTRKSSDSLLVLLQENPPENYWIIDVRDQEGGAKSEMKKYWKVLKKYKGKMALLVNFNTLSQAELFVLKARKKAVIMGETTRGMLTYGSNYGKSVALPSQKWMFYPTDMLGWPHHLRFEGSGISPDVVLSSQQDWITQARTFLTSERD